MINLIYKTLDQVNVSELSDVFTYVTEIVPIFTPLLLFAFFVIVMLGSFFSSKRLSGRGDFIVSFAVAGIVTAIAAVLMSLVAGLIATWLVVVCIVIAIIGIIILFLQNE